MSVEMFKKNLSSEIGTIRDCNDSSGMPSFEITAENIDGIAQNLYQWFSEQYDGIECTEEYAKEFLNETYPERSYTEPETLDELYTQMKNDDPNLPEWDSLPLFNDAEPDIENTYHVWSWDDTRKIVGSCSYDITIELRDDI